MLYSAIAVAWYGVLVLFVFHQVRTGRNAELPLNWIGFGVVTAIAYGYEVHANRRSLTSARFWLLLGAALAVQLCLGTLILWNLPRQSTIIWAVLLPLNCGAVAMYMEAFHGRAHRRKAFEAAQRRDEADEAQ